jgi:hypothetical protein
MIDSLDPLLKHLPPRTKTALVSAINACAKQLNLGPDWVQRWLSFTIVADALASYAHNGEAVFEFKGGAAIEMRLHRLHQSTTGETHSFRPRATKDLDAAFHGEMAELQQSVESALSTPRNGFAFRTALETPDAPNMRRFRVHVSYLEQGIAGTVARDLSNVKLEISAYEGTRYPADQVLAFSLKPFGIDGPSHLPCMTLKKQIAQKLHAVTDDVAGGKNDRFRDLVDLVMLSDLEPASPELRVVCEETFAIRQRHGWPPEIFAHATWIAPMEQRAVEMGLHVTSATAIIEHVTDYVQRVAGAS